MTTAPPTVRASLDPGRSDFYLATLLASAALALLAVVIQTGDESGVLAAARWLAIAPVLLAAYARRGLLYALILSAFFVTALAPAVLAARGAATFSALLVDLLAYGALLAVAAYLAATVADFLRTRQALSGAVRDWGALLEAASDLDEVLEFLLKQAAASVQAKDGALLALDPIEQRWEVLALRGAAPGRAPLTQGGRLSLAHWLIDQRQPLFLSNLADDRRFIAPADGAGQAVQSLLAQPLAGRDGDLLAVIVLLNKAGGNFDEADFAALADLAAAGEHAIEQASQYARTDHALAHRVQQLGVLQRTAAELNATMDPQAVVDETLAGAIAISGAELGLVSVDVPGAGRVHRAWNVQADDGILQRSAGLAVALRAPLAIPRGDDSVYSLQAQPGPRLAAPIRRAGRSFGLILVESNRPRAFGEEVLRTVGSLADHAAVALDNTRLFGEIRREKRKSDEIIETIADALFTVDAAGRVTTFNPAAEALTGWRAEEVIGHLTCDMLRCQNPADCRQHCLLMHALENGQRIEKSQWTVQQKPGGRRVVTLNATPLPAGPGQEGGLVVLMHDITSAWELERMQRELITAFSHELRTPLTNIGMITEMMLGAGDQEVDALEREQLQILQAQSRRLEEFAERMLQVSRLEAGASHTEARPVAINLLLAASADQWRPLLGGRAVHTLAAPAVWVWADEQAVQSVLDILLDNAAKYTPENSPIELSAWEGPPGFVTVAVDDQGPGIAADHQARLFERFYRVDNSDAQRVYGHGLGLYIARALATQMGGDLWVESEQGRGSRFAFTLPLMSEEIDEDPADRG